MASLYEIKQTYMDFLTQIEIGNIPDEAIADTLESLDGEFEEKADNIACLIKSLMADCDAIKQEEKTLKERRDIKQAKIDRMKDYLKKSMQELGKLKIETPRNVLSFRKSSSLFIADEGDFKQRHMDLCKVETSVTIPKSDITKLIKAGQEVKGAEIRESQNLQIK